MLDCLDPRSSDTREPGPGDPREADALNPRAAFASGLDLPRGHERERVYVHEHEYKLRRSETRALATIGTFRVVPANDLRDGEGRARDLRHGDLERLSGAGLIRRVGPVEGDRRTALVALTERGRELLEHHRTPEHERPQRYYAGPSNARELSHDAQLSRAYLRCAARLQAQGARMHRVVLDDALKRAYQAFLQAANRDQPESHGRPFRTLEEVQEWAQTHDLSMLDDGVQFPDLRIECEWPDGRREIEHVEVLTPHDRGAHAAAKAASGFTCDRGGGPRVGGRSGNSAPGERPLGS